MCVNTLGGDNSSQCSHVKKQCTICWQRCARQGTDSSFSWTLLCCRRKTSSSTVRLSTGRPRWTRSLTSLSSVSLVPGRKQRTNSRKSAFKKMSMNIIIMHVTSTTIKKNSQMLIVMGKCTLLPFLGDQIFSQQLVSLKNRCSLL